MRSHSADAVLRHETEPCTSTQVWIALSDRLWYAQEIVAFEEYVVWTVLVTVNLDLAVATVLSRHVRMIAQIMEFVCLRVHVHVKQDILVWIVPQRLSQEIVTQDAVVMVLVLIQESADVLRVSREGYVLKEVVIRSVSTVRVEMEHVSVTIQSTVPTKVIVARRRHATKIATDMYVFFFFLIYSRMVTHSLTHSFSNNQTGNM